MLFQSSANLAMVTGAASQSLQDAPASLHVALERANHYESTIQ